jgi:hypothetical protein
MCCGVFLANILHRLESSPKEDQGTANCLNLGEPSDEEASATCPNSANATRIMDAQIISWSIFISLTLIHIWANYIGMQMLRLRTLNRDRANVAIQPLVEYCGRRVLERQTNSIHKTKSPISKSDDWKSLDSVKASRNILPPRVVSESLWKAMCGILREGNIRLRIRLKDLVRRSSASSFSDNHLNPACNWSQGYFKSEKYMFFIELNGGDFTGNSSLRTITVMLHVGANDRDELQAFIHASILCWCLKYAANEEPKQLPKILSRYVYIILTWFVSSIR